MNMPSTNASSQRKHQLKWLPSLLSLSLLFVFSATSVSSSTSVSYSDHCTSVIPESSPTIPDSTVFPFLQTSASHYTSGDKILGNLSSEFSFNFQRHVSFRPTKNIFKTTTNGVYKIEAYLTFPSSYRPRNSTRIRNSLTFVLNGFWSQFSGKLCMVGSASWYSNEGNLLNLDATLKLKYAMNSTLFTSLITGTLESLGSPSDFNYFEPISILIFGSTTNNYTYTLVSGEFDRLCPGGISVPQTQSLGLQPREFCSAVWRGIDDFKLKYSCSSLQNCTPLGEGTGNLPPKMFLNAIQCSEEERKVQYLVRFENSYRSFDPATTLVAEGSWDENKKQTCIVACRVLNSAGSLENARVGDCSIRLSLRYPSFWSIRNRESIVGQIWTNKTVNEPGYFNRIKFESYHNSVVGLSGLRYEYTVIDRVRKLCPIRKPVERKGERYPKGNSNDMRFDMYVRDDSTGKHAWGYAVPVFVGDQSYEQFPLPISRTSKDKFEFEAKNSSYSGPLNISYMVSVYLNSSANLSISPVEIFAEGVYDDETGNLCMVGCRKLDLAPELEKSRGDSMDCELLLRFRFPPIKATNGGTIKGSIESMRKDTDPLYFHRLNISAIAFYTEEARRSIWRMDLEITMVLISTSLSCVFVGLQLFYTKKNPQVLPSVSLAMFTILTLGHMIPLVLNFEALFVGSHKTHNQQNVLLRSGGWLEVNEVVVRVVTMVAFLLQFRLLQLAWSARLGDGNQKGLWVAEKKALFVSSSLYIVGALAALIYSKAMVSSTAADYQPPSLWGALRSYGGLVLDAFLFPQILLNIFRISQEKSLCHSFYIGTTCVRLLPHLYDLYRAYSFGRGHNFGGSYIYANPGADFYSTAWDVIISGGGVLLAAVVYFQQRFGGQWILPRRFRDEGEGYEKVPAVSHE